MTDFDDSFADAAFSGLFRAADLVSAVSGNTPLGEAARVTSIALHSAEGLIGELRRESDGSVRLVQALEQAAGASANKAAHLAGLREALLQLPLPRDASAAEQDKYVDAIMAEVTRRMP